MTTFFNLFYGKTLEVSCGSLKMTGLLFCDWVLPQDCDRKARVKGVMSPLVQQEKMIIADFLRRV